jgi:RNA polymerase subunit RPABC4/transcription elongation factor Spt4
LLGICGFAIAYWIYQDGKNIDKLLRLRKTSRRTEANAEPTAKEHEGIRFLECPECGEELEEDFDVCPMCGYELKPVICPKCGKEISRAFNYCPYCGYKTKDE